MAMMRLNANGTPDPSFDGDGTERSTTAAPTTPGPWSCSPTARSWSPEPARRRVHPGHAVEPRRLERPELRRRRHAAGPLRRRRHGFAVAASARRQDRGRRPHDRAATMTSTVARLNANGSLDTSFDATGTGRSTSAATTPPRTCWCSPTARSWCGLGSPARMSRSRGSTRTARSTRASTATARRHRLRRLDYGYGGCAAGQRQDRRRGQRGGADRRRRAACSRAAHSTPPSAAMGDRRPLRLLRVASAMALLDDGRSPSRVAAAEGEHQLDGRASGGRFASAAAVRPGPAAARRRWPGR